MISALDFPWLSPILMSPIAGSFVGVLIRRLPNGRAVAWARSQCESCQRPLTLTDLVPIASYVALRGRCATCRAPIAPFHLAIELAAVGAYWHLAGSMPNTCGCRMRLLCPFWPPG